MSASLPASICGLPRAWSDRLFAATLTGQIDALWSATAAILLEAFPEDILVVWETFSHTLYRRARDGSVSADRNSPVAFALRSPQLYNALNLGFVRNVRSFDDGALMEAGLATDPLLAPLRPLHAGTLDLPHRRDVHATLILYGRAAAAPARIATLKRLRAALQECFVALFETRRQVAAGAGLGAFLRALPAGLILVDWFGTVLVVNDEGYRQSLLWNEAPRRRSVKDARKRFAIAGDILQGRQKLQAAWIDWLRGEGAKPSLIEVRNAADPSLRAEVSIVEDPALVGATPCFMTRFLSVYSRAELDLIPSQQQVAMLADLSPAERSVALLVQTGLSNKEIAARLGRQIGTIKDHLSSIYGKIGVTRRSQLIRILLTPFEQKP